jgi:DNA-binding PadR family transcriptional regulator
VTPPPKKPGPADPEQLLPLTPAVFHILVALAGGELHGYAIMQDVIATTDGQIRMGPGTLYGTIKRMLDAGLIEECGDRQDPNLGDERRRYYRLTGFGGQVAKAETFRLSKALREARRRGLAEGLGTAGGEPA